MSKKKHKYIKSGRLINALWYSQFPMAAQKGEHASPVLLMAFSGPDSLTRKIGQSYSSAHVGKFCLLNSDIFCDFVLNTL